MWHYANYKLWGDYRDKVAYKLLANTDASEEMEEGRLQASREAIKNRDPEVERQRGINISKAKKLKGHITSEQVKKRHQEGNFYSEEGRQALRRNGQNNKRKFGKKVLCVETGKVYGSIREAAASMGFRRRSITESINQGRSRGGYTFTMVE